MINSSEGKRKLLFICHRIPYPPNKGDKIRSFHILKYLARKHEVSLACLVDSKTDLNYIDDLKQYCKTIDWVLINPTFRPLFSTKALFNNRPLSVAYFYSKKLQIKINRRLQEMNFDLVFAYSSQMAEYLKSVTPVRRVMDFVDTDSRKWQQYSNYQTNFLLKWLFRLESRRLAAYEKWIAQTFDTSLLVSDTEANIFRNEIYDNDKVVAIHNGVDHNFFTPNGKREADSQNSPTILFTGAMDYYPNIDAVQWFLQDIFPLIQQAIPAIKFYIVGRNPGQSIKKMHNGGDIVVTGYVKDIREYFNKANIFVAPFRIACGIQNKILEALSMRLPVVATSIGAEGLKAQECPVIIRDHPEDFARQIVTLLENSQSKESNGLREWILENYDWHKNLSNLDKLLAVDT